MAASTLVVWRLHPNIPWWLTRSSVPSERSSGRGPHSRSSVSTNRPAISPRPLPSSNAEFVQTRRTSSCSVQPVPASPRPPRGSSRSSSVRRWSWHRTRHWPRSWPTSCETCCRTMRSSTSSRTTTTTNPRPTSRRPTPTSKRTRRSTTTSRDCGIRPQQTCSRGETWSWSPRCRASMVSERRSRMSTGPSTFRSASRCLAMPCYACWSMCSTRATTWHSHVVRSAFAGTPSRSSRRTRSSRCASSSSVTRSRLCTTCIR